MQSLSENIQIKNIFVETQTSLSSALKQNYQIKSVRNQTFCTKWPGVTPGPELQGDNIIPIINYFDFPICGQFFLYLLAKNEIK